MGRILKSQWDDILKYARGHSYDLSDNSENIFSKVYENTFYIGLLGNINKEYKGAMLATISIDSDAVYITKSGKFLDTKGPYNDHQHINIANYLTDKYHYKESSKYEALKKARDTVRTLYFTVPFFTWLACTVISLGIAFQVANN